MSVRLKLTLSYAGFLMVAGVLLVAVVWLFLLRYVPEEAIAIPARAPSDASGPLSGALFVPGQSDLWEAFAPRAAVALALLLVIGMVGGWMLAGRMLAPLSRIADATRAVAGGSLSHRIQLPGRNDEFRELADAFDGMLNRLEVHVAEQQRFAANASHELRTPLAITQTLLDVARSDPGSDKDELVARLHGVNTRAIDLVEALLVLSHADQGTFGREPVDLSLIAEEATETLLPLAEERGVTIRTCGEAAPTIGSHPLLLQMMTNLVHNAIVHNVTDRGTVRVTTGALREAALLTVENTGDTVSRELIETLTEPFQRGTQRVRGDHGGVGLGLAIVKSIVRAHDGILTLSPRAAGGLCVKVQLPAAHLPSSVPHWPSMESS